MERSSALGRKRKMKTEISIFSVSLDAGKPVADIILMKGEEVKRVTENLD
jgi:hypothetical protein